MLGTIEKELHSLYLVFGTLMGKIGTLMSKKGTKTLFWDWELLSHVSCIKNIIGQIGTFMDEKGTKTLC